MCRRELVPDPGPAEHPERGQIGLVGDRAVGVALGVGGLAAPVRLDVVANLAARVGGPTRGAPVLDREMAVGVDAVRDPLGADHAGEADVDHVRVPPVEADPEAADEHGRADQQPDRPHGRASRRAIFLPDPEAPRDQPDQAWIDERHRGEDVAAVEEPERNREREHHQQVNRAQREGPPPVDEPDQEERAEPEPVRIGVDLPAAERAGSSACHSPSDLRARVRGQHGAGHVVDRSCRDLAGLAREDVHGPDAVLVARADRGSRRVALEPAGDLRVPQEDLLRGGPGEARRSAGCGRLCQRRLGDAEADGRGRRRDCLRGRGESARRGEREEKCP